MAKPTKSKKPQHFMLVYKSFNNTAKIEFLHSLLKPLTQAMFNGYIFDAWPSIATKEFNMNNITINNIKEIARISLDSNCFDNENNYKHTLNMFEKIANEISNDKNVIANSILAMKSYCRANEDYVIHKFKEYYAISRITNIFPRELDSEILVYDKNRIYPLQEIEIKLDFKYKC